MFERDQEYWDRPFFYHDRDYNIPDECRFEHSPEENHVEMLKHKDKLDYGQSEAK